MSKETNKLHGKCKFYLMHDDVMSKYTINIKHLLTWLNKQ